MAADTSECRHSYSALTFPPGFLPTSAHPMSVTPHDDRVLVTDRIGDRAIVRRHQVGNITSRVAHLLFVRSDIDDCSGAHM
jgi:hypothetical protein